MDLYVVEDFLYTFRKKKQVCYLIATIGIALTAIAGWALYSYQVNRTIGNAQQAFSQAYTEFEKMKQVELKDRRWSDVVDVFQKGYELYRTTPFGPYFLAYKAQALLFGQDYAGARLTTAQVLESIKKPSPLHYLYATQYALMQLDASEAETAIRGRDELDALANDIQNPERDRALYYAGYFASKNGDSEKAHRLWSQLVARFSSSRSPWAELAKQELALIAKQTPQA